MLLIDFQLATQSPTMSPFFFSIWISKIALLSNEVVRHPWERALDPYVNCYQAQRFFDRSISGMVPLDIKSPIYLVQVPSYCTLKPPCV